MAKFIKTPVKGMCDMLPGDMRLREHVLGMIKQTYAGYGFMQIETPVMEHIENLTSNQGGDNEKLIFKVLKRGRDLEKAMAAPGGELADNGLRYDLTVPLARYFSNNMQNLPVPFKALQIGNVWRADNPQKGRFRQFTQCDIDILGEESDLAEIELIGATANMLSMILKEAGIKDFTVRINDRRILAATALAAGFEQEDIPGVLISLDKYDKIGLEGIKKELLEGGCSEQVADKYLSCYGKEYSDCRAFCADISEEYLDRSVVDGMDEIIKCVETMVDPAVKLQFDPTLVRGMGYYTGPIFEVTLDGYGFSIAGGGRYDDMIGHFCGQKTCACGFSIGFERIITILSEKLTEGVKLPEGSTAILIHKDVDTAGKLSAMKEARELRAEGKTVIVQQMKKNLGAQMGRLEQEGYTEFRKIYND